jgi:hypothetical protein
MTQLVCECFTLDLLGAVYYAPKIALYNCRQDLCMNRFKTVYSKPDWLIWKQFYDEYFGGHSGSEGE